MKRSFTLCQKFQLALIGLLFPVFFISAATAQDYSRLKAKAEKLFIEASFSRAHKIYQKAGTLNLSPQQKRWVDFRLADTLWRAQAGSKTADSSKFDQARHGLEVLVRDIKRIEERDRVWAEVEESLGDFWWVRRNSKNWGAAWTHYQKALDWWAGTKDIETARDRYTGIVWRIASPPWREPYYYYGYYGNVVPLNILENVLKIAQKEADKRRAHYLVAMTLRRQGAYHQQRRVSEEFEAAMQGGKSSEWYDDALNYYAEWLATRGEVIILENGSQTRKRDYPKALKLYRKLLETYKKGETRFYDLAKNQIENITKPVLRLSVSNTFLPGSKIQFHLNWRNLDGARLSLYPVDLTHDIDFKNQEGVNSWIQQIKLGLKNKLKSWSEDLKSAKDYHPGNKAFTLERDLSPGAYILEATGGGLKARDLILVTDTAIVLKSAKQQALVYFCDVFDGSPIPNAGIKLSERYYNGKKWVWRHREMKTDKDGLAVFKLKASANNKQLFAAARSDDRQAFSVGSSRSYGHRHQPWKVYVFTDRPAYRPKETAEWKLIARTYDGSVYHTPSGETIEYRINDPRGSKLKEGNLKLNPFGSAWGKLDLGENIPLGPYQITFWTQGRKKHIGSATLFRLEEYKLPEFKVSITTPEEDGKKKSFRLGETVEVEIQADYYFGAPVANANVEVVVYQKPFRHSWRPTQDYPWYYEDIYRRPSHYYGRGQQIKREVIKTDAMGKARITFDSKRNNQDLEYLVEARVTDASRREVVASDKVRVTRHSHYVYLRPEHNLYRPLDKTRINIKALDANNQPVEVEGKIKVTRDYWFEIWLDPDGNEVKDEELKILKQKNSIFPPPLDPGNSGWRLKFRGYQHDDILTRSVKTNAKGEAEFMFVPGKEGYYRIAWTSEDKGREPIKSETTVWAATHASKDIGYRHGGVEIIVDKDTFRVGEKASVMLTANASNRYVLFSIEGEDLYSYRLVHLFGSVKLIQLDIEEKHVPNIFLQAEMVSDSQIYRDVKQVVVPPVKNFLDVTVESDREQYQPREEGFLTVTARDHKGKPVSAEVAIGLVDESVYAIQKELAEDPRKFFYGKKRQKITRTQSSFQRKRYVKLVKGFNDQLMDEKVLDRLKKQKRQEGEEFRYYNERDSLMGGPGGRGDFAQYKARASAPMSIGALSDDAAFGGTAMLESSAAEIPRKMGAKKDGGGGDPAVQVRSDFRTTVLWLPSILTGKDGKARVQVKFPDSLTQWRATARTVTQTNQFGIATSKTHTQKPLIARLQAPRFFVVGDTLTVSAVINNNTGQPMNVTPSIDAQGVTVTGIVIKGKSVKGETGPISIPARGEERVDWLVSVQQSGHAKIKVTALGKDHADAMEKSFIVHEHGIEKFIAKSGKLRSDDFTVKLDIPKERKAGSTSLTVDIAPSMAVTMLDALPYLIDYPYGCTEQTMSRFLPAVVTAKTLSDLGLSPQSLANKIFGGIDPEAAGKTHPKGKKDLGLLDDMVKQGLNRLYDFQHGDGGWGWWKKGESDHFMSAYVLWGLVMAKDAGREINADFLRRAYRYLDKELVEEEINFDQQAWMLHALSSYHFSYKQKRTTKFQSRALENLWRNRSKLNAYTRALLALAVHHYGHSKKAKILIRNLENGVKKDDTPDTSVIQRGGQKSHKAALGTAHWGEDGIYWRWSDGGVEATAFALRALLAIDPKNKLIEPVTNWLIKNRRGSHWSNTRDTAIVVLAMNDYLRVSGELDADLEYELIVNGKSIAKTKVEDVLSAPSRYVIDPKLIRDGANDIRVVRRGGKGPIYFAAQAKFFSLEDPILPAGNEIFLRRQYHKLEGRPTLLKGYVYEKTPLNEGDSVTSGERVETVITIETKNNYEYLVIEDLKPAGLEAVQIKSGESLYARELKSSAVDRKFTGTGSPPSSSSPGIAAEASIILPPPGPGNASFTGRSRWVYQELRDRKVVLFIDKLPEGVWEIRYTLRAEVPGKFHALPVMGHAMYIPEIRANGAEIRFSVKDRE